MATRGQSGSSSIEYAFLASLIAMAILGAVLAAGLSLEELYCSVSERMPFADDVDC